MARYVTDSMLEVTRDFDQIVMADQNGGVRGRLVFKTALFFEGGGTVEGQTRAVETLVYLASGVSDQLVGMQTADPNGALAPFDLDSFRTRSLAAIEAGHAKGEFFLDAGLFGAPFDPQTGGVGAFGGSIAAGAPVVLEDGDLSYFEFSTTLMWDAPNDYENQIARTLEAARMLKPRHGLAGMAVQFDRIYEGSTGHGLSFPYLKRFPGLHCSREVSFVVKSTMNRTDTNRIFSTNWLTLLADDIVTELGGAVALETAIGPGCSMQSYEGGALLQAGPYPQPGDANQGIMLKNYQSVAKATAPVRFEDYKVGLMVVPPPLDPLAETLAWVRRFD